MSAFELMRQFFPYMPDDAIRQVLAEAQGRYDEELARWARLSRMRAAYRAKGRRR